MASRFLGRIPQKQKQQPMAIEDHPAAVAADRITELKRCIQELDRKIIKLMKRADSITSQDELISEDEVEKEVQSLKMDQENLKKSLKELMKEHTVGGLRIDEFLKGIERIKVEEDHYENNLNDLMIKINREGKGKGYVEAVNELCIKIASVLEFLCRCFTAEESKKQEDYDYVNTQVEAIKEGTIEVGAQISRLLVDVMIMLSERDALLRQTKFQPFKVSLENDSGENAPAINKFFHLIETVQGTLTSMEIPAGLPISYPAASSHGGRDEIIEEDADSDGSIIEKILNALRAEILNLNLIMLDYSKADPTVADVFSMEKDLKECEKNSKIIEEEVKQCWACYSYLFFESIYFENVKKAMEGKINEIWNVESE